MSLVLVSCFSFLWDFDSRCCCFPSQLFAHIINYQLNLRFKQCCLPFEWQQNHEPSIASCSIKRYYFTLSNLTWLCVFSRYLRFFKTMHAHPYFVQLILDFSLKESLCIWMKKCIELDHIKSYYYYWIHDIKINSYTLFKKTKKSKVVT